MPVIDPSFSIPDLAREAQASLVLNGRTLNTRLVPNGAKPPEGRWTGWSTVSGTTLGAFSLGPDFSGQGQAAKASARPRGRGPTPVEFIARWDRGSVGTVIVAQQGTQPGSPFAGALEFGLLRWSGLAAAFGPAPGL